MVFAEGWRKWEGRGKEGGEGLGPAPILTPISRDQQLVGHNIFQCLIHISTAPLAATQMLYPKKGEFWITLKPLEHCVLLTLWALGAAQASQPQQRLVEKYPLASVSTSVGKNNGVHAHISHPKPFPAEDFI